jgi:transposase
MKEIVTLSMHEIHRLKILEQVDQGGLSLVSGTGVLKISYRHGKRLMARYRRDGPEGLAHKGRGRVAHNAFDPEVRDLVIKLHQERYSQFNDTHFTEMLKEREDLQISRETVRGWLREAGIRPKRRRRAPRHRSRRPRRPQIGLMMQWDGSPHKWFGPKRPSCSLIHATDDATNYVLGLVFRPTEDSIGYLKLLDMVLRRHGIPASVYQDRHSILQRNDKHWSHEEELAGSRFPTHIGRVLEELVGIKTLTAYSAQGKGRIERQGGTFQDRLIAEMDLEGITDMDKANKWVENNFIDRFNRRFAKKAEKPGCVFRKISDEQRYRLVSFALQVYLETTPAHPKRGHFCFADRGTS